LQDELAFAKQLALHAGATCLTYYGRPIKTEDKPGHGPVTEADHVLNHFLVTELQQRFPDDGFLAEESVDQFHRLSKKRVWAIDPIDGTREFIAQSGEFSVMIGLCEDKAPVLGVIYRPTTQTIYYAAKGLGAWRQRPNESAQRISVSPTTFSSLRMAVAKPWRGRRVEVIRSSLGIEEMLPMGSISLKLAMIACGEADLYVNPSGYLAEWDTCAGEAIICEAGGVVTDLTGKPLSYNNEDITRPKGIVASNGASHPEILKGIRELRSRLAQEALASSSDLPVVTIDNKT
jgi:3'(2'), 5'-bisphosphate nucleotidase